MSTPSQWIEQNQKALNHLLDGEPEEARQWVHSFLTQSGSALEDPFCSQIAANAYLAYVIRNKPDEIRSAFEIAESNMFKRIGTEFDSKRESYQQALSAEVEARISRMAERLIAERFDSPSETEDKEDKSVQGLKTATHKLAHSAIVASSGIIGLVLGLFISSFLGSKNPISPTAADNHLLNWAKSKQGEFARQLIEWNGDRLVSLKCEAEAQRDAITLAIRGVQATRGVCAVFVRDPRESKPQQVSE
ncbi:MAG: hypothetical protein F6K54_05445 [Okeania sp. SIO3B5]|uniref:DUF6753 family protein n=1 Tax=Okeania sp. SIO3B5 TaxID=2607811 RepID=UPI0013FE5EF4|nr:DUF6753 family protein [Okeania sp. SIO3B5]NEO52563.1 hypothetical protein [Okeania sp. SIO3B5]